MNFDNVGPNCHMDIQCATHGKHGRQIKAGKLCRWLVGCTRCGWFPDVSFKLKPDAVRHFFEHKHDIITALPAEMQAAIQNLEGEGLL